MNYFEQLYEELHQSQEYAAEYLPLAITGIIRRYMLQNGITQEELAERLGVSQPNIAKQLRQGQNLTLKSLSKVAAALDAEWIGIELIPRAEAAFREKRAAWPRETIASFAPFTCHVEGLTNDQETGEATAYAETLSLSA